MRDRARLTITDVLYVLVAVAALAALYPAFAHALDIATPALAAGEELLFTSLLPIAVLVLLAVIYVEAKSGMG